MQKNKQPFNGLFFRDNLAKPAPERLSHSLANRDSCPTPAKNEGIEYLQSWTHRN